MSNQQNVENSFSHNDDNKACELDQNKEKASFSERKLDDKKESAKKYAIITPSTRMAFIKRVLSKQATIKEAAQEFGIKFSTSKAILQTFRREGRVGKKKFRARKLKETLSEEEGQQEPEQQCPNKPQKVQSLQDLDCGNQQSSNLNALLKLNFGGSVPELDQAQATADQLKTLLLKQQLLMPNSIGFTGLMPFLDDFTKRQLLQQQLMIVKLQIELQNCKTEYINLKAMLEKEKEKQTTSTNNNDVLASIYLQINLKFIQVKEEAQSIKLNTPMQSSMNQPFTKVPPFNLDEMDPTMKKL